MGSTTKPLTRREKRLLAEGGPHAFFKIKQIDQGWKTGVARCACGEEFPVRFYLAETKHHGKQPCLELGQRCPKAPEPVAAPAAGSADRG